MASELRLFISHSAFDAAVAERLVELIQNALTLPASSIRCTSVDGYRLPGGADTEEQLRSETLEAESFIGLISEHSVRSVYVAFELGARWSTKKHLVPLLAPGVDVSVLDGPLKSLNALRCDSRSQLHQLIGELGQHLGVKQASPAVYERYLDRILSPGSNDPFPHEPTQSTTATSLSSFLSRVKMFSSESNKLQHIMDNAHLLPRAISFDEFISLMRQFSSEGNRLRMIEMLLSRLSPPSEQDFETLLSLFSSEANKRQAFTMVSKEH